MFKSRPPNRNWYSRYKPPPIKEMMRTGSLDWVEFVKQSEKIAPMIYRKLRDYLEEPIGDRQILDFGCGVGRIALYLHARWNAPSHCRDVNRGAVRYLARQLPPVDCKVSKYEPPLDLGDATLDAAYSVSVWTHLAPELQVPWLKEIRRVLKPGAVALVTTAGALAVRMRARRGVSGWTEVTPEALREQGMIYRPYVARARGMIAPGIVDRYGLVAHDPDWIRATWSEHMDVVAIHERAIDDIQDLVVLRKRPN